MYILYATLASARLKLLNCEVGMYAYIHARAQAQPNCNESLRSEFNELYDGSRKSGVFLDLRFATGVKQDDITAMLYVAHCLYVSYEHVSDIFCLIGVALGRIAPAVARHSFDCICYPRITQCRIPCMFPVISRVLFGQHSYMFLFASLCALFCIPGTDARLRNFLGLAETLEHSS